MISAHGARLGTMPEDEDDEDEDVGTDDDERSCTKRCFVSAAALALNVSTRNCDPASSRCRCKCNTRCTNVVVFPLPGPARMMSGVEMLDSMASRCAAFIVSLVLTSPLSSLFAALSPFFDSSKARLSTQLTHIL